MHSYGPYFAPWSVTAEQFREELIKQSPVPIDLYEASLDTARFREPNQEGALVGYLRALFADRKLDLVVSIGPPAARFFLRYRPELFPSTPMVITGAEQRTFDHTNLTVLDTIVASTFELPRFIDNILQVLPETKTVAVAIGASPLERFWVDEMRKAFQPFANQVKFEWLHELPFSAMLARVAELPPHSAVFYATVRVDAKGIPQDHNRAFADLRAVTAAPMFSYTENYLGQGLVGGPLQSQKKGGRRAAEVAVRVLRGEAPGEIRTPPLGLSTPAYDWRELQRWNISEARLPSGSSVLFREPTVWETYRWHLTAIFVALFIQAAMISWLLFERYGRRSAELESRRRLLELMHLNRAATAGALSASLSHELYQPLSSILSNAEAAELLLRTNPLDVDQVQEILTDIRHADLRATEIIRQLRNLLKRESKLELQAFDLNEVIGSTLHILSPEAKKRNIVLNSDGVRQPLPVLANQIHLQQVLLNLASNGMDAMTETGARPRIMTIHTALGGESEVRVSVSDSGIGIPNENLKGIFNSFYSTKQQGTGLGLSIARTIVETYGGKIWAENRIQGGATFHFTVPLNEACP